MAERPHAKEGVNRAISLFPMAAPLRRYLCVLGLFLAAGAALGQSSGRPGDGLAFDRFADRLERGQLPISSHQDAVDLLGKLRALMPQKDASRELRYRYLNCILALDEDPAAGKAYAEQGLADARRTGDADAEVNFHFCRGSNLEVLTTPRDALPDYDAGIAIARHQENLRLVADGLTWRGAVQSLLGEHALALVDFLEAQKFYDSAGEPVESEQNLFNIAIAYRRMGLRTESRRYLDRIMSVAMQRKDTVLQMDAHMQLGFLDSQPEAPDLPAARRHFETAIRLAAGSKAHGALGSAHLGLARVLNQQGRFRAALGELDAAHREFAAVGDRSEHDMVALQAGEAHAGLGDHAQAIKDYAQAEAMLAKSGNPRYLTELLEHRSESYEALGKPLAALADLRRMIKVQAALDRKAKSYTTTLMSYQFDIARREQENRKLAADRQLRDQQLAALKRVRHWQRLALALGGLLIILLLWQAVRLLRRSRRLQRMAMTDALTQVANRRGVEQMGRRAIEQSHETAQPLSLVALDVDHFKRVNDSYGHPVGDMVLTRLVVAAQESLRQIDHLGRIGGEEFVAILPGSGLQAATRIAERLRRDIEALDLGDLAPDLRISISLGVAELQPGETLDGLIARADQALYLAKQQGRNRVMPSLVEQPQALPTEM